VFANRRREELLSQLKVMHSPPASAAGRTVDSPWILVDSDGEEVIIVEIPFWLSTRPDRQCVDISVPVFGYKLPS